MIHIFYFLTILPIFYEFRNLINPTNYLNFTSVDIDFEAFKRKEIKLTLKQSLYILFTILYGWWVIVGLFTPQGVLFLMIILIERFFKKTTKVMVRIDAFITLAILIFIILNAYQFNLDIFNLFLFLTNLM